MNNQITSLEFSHFPVMLNEVLQISSPLTNRKFIDCTFGGGGYSKEILKFSNTNYTDSGYADCYELPKRFSNRRDHSVIGKQSEK